jgi:putative phosphoesterase
VPDLVLTKRRTFEVPLTIGVVSDTHVWASGNRRLPREVLTLFERVRVDLVLHAGDINDSSVLETLAEVAPVIAVRGNNDAPDLQRALPLQDELRAGSQRIGLIHGHGGKTARDVAFGAFDSAIDLVVYGHSHIPRIERIGETIYFNPGSPTDRRWGPHFGVGIVRCDEAGIHPDLILFTRSSDLDVVTEGGEKRKPSAAGECRRAVYTRRLSFTCSSRRSGRKGRAS